MARKQTNNPGDPENERAVLVGITPQQQTFIEHLLMGKSITDAALSVGVSRRAAVYWLHDPYNPVRREYERQRSDMRQMFHSRIAGLHQKALAALETALEDETQPAIRFQAAKFLYEAHMQEYSNIRWAAAPDRLVAGEIESAYYPANNNGVYLYDDKGKERLPDD